MRQVNRKVDAECDRMINRVSKSRAKRVKYNEEKAEK